MLDSFLGRGVDVTTLEVLGKRASSSHLDRGVPMTEAVLEQVRGRNDLTDEHIRRVTEFANNDAFTRVFKQASGSHKLVSFDGGPADASRILDIIRESSKEVVMKAASRNYIKGAESYELHNGPVLHKVAHAGNGTQVKISAELRDIGQLRAAVDRAEHEQGMLRRQYENAIESLCKEAKASLREGACPSDIAVAIHEASPHHMFTKLALKHLSERLADEPAVYRERTKLAADIEVDMSHPLIEAFEELVKTASDFYGMVSAHERLRDTLEKAEVTLKELI